MGFRSEKSFKSQTKQNIETFSQRNKSDCFSQQIKISKVINTLLVSLLVILSKINCLPFLLRNSLLIICFQTANRLIDWWCRSGQTSIFLYPVFFPAQQFAMCFSQQDGELLRVFLSEHILLLYRQLPIFHFSSSHFLSFTDSVLKASLLSNQGAFCLQGQLMFEVLVQLLFKQITKP